LLQFSDNICDQGWDTSQNSLHTGLRWYST